MRMVQTTPYALACRFLGMREIPGAVHNPAVVAMLQLDAAWVKDDETAWCSAFVNYVAWLLEMKRSKSLRARSWLDVGFEVDSIDAEPGFHVVVLKRGGGNQPGPEVRDAPGHVGFFAGWDTGGVRVLGGNQGNAVSIASFPKAQILGIREI
jgi:uncharacterized protein (TIGR02594 family)